VEYACAFAFALALLALGNRILRQSGAALGLPAALVAVAAGLVTR
jgi:hypothetical protein